MTRQPVFSLFCRHYRLVLAAWYHRFGDGYRAFDHPLGGLVGNFDRDSDNFMHTPL